MLLAAHALAAGPLAASQPGVTILDPLSASLLGVFLFGEHIRTGPADLAGEALALALAVVIAGAAVLSHSCHLAGQDSQPPAPARATVPRAGLRLPAQAARQMPARCAGWVPRARAGSARPSPDAAVTTVRAQRIRSTAVSGCSP
jgi:hypothetical protein